MTGEHITQEDADEYAIGVLEPGAAQEVVLHAAECAACRAIVEQSERAATALLLGAQRRSAPARMRRNVLRSTGILRPGPVSWAARVVTAGVGIAASIVAIAAFTGMLGLRGQVEDLEDANVSLRGELDEALSQQVEIAALTQKLDDQERVSSDLRAAAQNDRDLLVALLSPESTIAEVISVNEADGAIGRFVWDEQQKRAWFVASRLQQLPAGQTYQLWVNSGGNFSSLGVFAPDPTGFARYATSVPQGLESYESAVVTIEVAPGADARTGPSVFVTDLSSIRP